MKISVIIPVYNAEKFLSRCLDSIIKQTYADWEVVAVDDGSKDGSFLVLQDYASKDSRFIVSTYKNHGPGYTRNVAMSKISGDYIVFLDSDDYIEPAYFEDLVKCMSTYSSDVVFIDIIQETPDGKLIKHEEMSRYKKCSKGTIIRHQMTGKLPWGGCRKAVRAKLILDNNIIYSNDTVGEEAIFSFSVLHHAKVISFIEKKYYHYVNYPYSQSKKGDDDPYGPICKNLESYLRTIGEYDNYKKTINSFAFTAFVLNVYKVTKNHGLANAWKLSMDALLKFKAYYSFDMDIASLEFRVRSVIPFAKANMIFPIIMAAKLKSYFSTRQLQGTKAHIYQY